jgi:uncharacterized protein (DUF983 family)
MDDEREPKKDTLREGSRVKCPSCGETHEVVGGKLVKTADRTEYNKAVGAKRGT